METKSFKILKLFSIFAPKDQEEKEIAKALRIKEEYYEYKREHDTGL